MKLGVCYWATDEALPPTDFAIALEERGFESMWLGDHTHVPLPRTSDPRPGAAPAKRETVPEAHKRLLDPFVALAMAAAVTKVIKLGTSVCLLAYRDPILVAKEVATIDHLSGGRFQFGVGFGSRDEEMLDHGVDPAHRHALVREKVAALKALWTQDKAEYEGSHVRIPPMWLWPKPVQKPHPPILMGASGPIGIKHTIEYADGWMPVAEQVHEEMRQLREAALNAGRDPGSIEVTMMAPKLSLEELIQYREAGVHRVIVWMPPPYDSDVVARTLDDWAPLNQLLEGAGRPIVGT